MGNFSVIVVTFVLLVSFNAAQGRRYFGCFEPNNNYELLTVAAPFTVDKCAAACLARNKDTVLAAIKNTECRCGSTITTKPVKQELCNIICGSEICGGQSSASIYVATAALIESEQEKAESTANFPTFEGCFGNSESDITFNELAQSWDDENSNLRCAQHCRRNGYIISATKENFCGCSNTLPSTMYATAVEVKLATGAQSECNARCTGMIPSATACQADECCGGHKAFTVYTTGEVNAVRQLLVNAVNALNRNQQSLLKKLTKVTDGTFFTVSDWSIEINKWNEGMNYNCPNDAPFVGVSGDFKTESNDRLFKVKCGQTSDLKAYDCAWKERVNEFGRRFTFSCPSGQFISGIRSEFDHGTRSRQFHFRCCNSPRVPLTNTCTWSNPVNDFRQLNFQFQTSPNGNSYIQGLKTTLKPGEPGDSKYQFCVATVYGGSNYGFSVRLRAKLNSYSNGGEGGNSNSVCELLSTSRDHTCKPLPNLGLHYVKIYMKNMQRLLVHGDPISVEPLGEFDTEYDNSHASKDNKLTKTFQITKTTETTVNTQAGINIGVEIGATANVEVDALFVKASAGVSLKASFEASMTIGYSNKNSAATLESFSTEVVVPAGKKVLLNLFKEKYDLSVKWRANLVANGFLDIVLNDDMVARVDVGQVLSDSQRDMYAFGTMKFGDRQKITAVTAFFEKDGVVSKPPKPEASMKFDKKKAEEEVTRKYKLSA